MNPSREPKSGGRQFRDPQEDEKLQQQRKAAREPQLPTKEAPKPKPPETGKPLWDKPHSA